MEQRLARSKPGGGIPELCGVPMHENGNTMSTALTQCVFTVRPIVYGR